MEKVTLVLISVRDWVYPGLLNADRRNTSLVTCFGYNILTCQG